MPADRHIVLSVDLRLDPTPPPRCGCPGPTPARFRDGDGERLEDVTCWRIAGHEPPHMGMASFGIGIAYDFDRDPDLGPSEGFGLCVGWNDGDRAVDPPLFVFAIVDGVTGIYPSDLPTSEVPDAG